MKFMNAFVPAANIGLSAAELALYFHTGMGEFILLSVISMAVGLWALDEARKHP